MNLQQTTFFILCYALPMGLIGQINAPCPSAIIPTPIDVAVWSFSLDSYPDSTTVSWLVNGEAISSDSAFTQSFMAGNYLIEAMVSAPQCPSTSTLTYNLQTSACGITIEAAEQESGFFTFTALGYPEEYPMYWQLGDDTLLWETWVVDHAFATGLHEVCAWYTSDFCPDTIRNCITVEVLPPPCTAAFLADNSQPMLLHCTSFETNPEASFMWYIDGTPISEESDPSMTLYPGIRTVCLEVATPTCTAAQCDTVIILCDAPSNTVEMALMAYGTTEGTETVSVEGFNVFNETLSVAIGDTLHWMYCTDVNCFVGVLWRDALTPMQADSIVVTAQYLTPNAEPTRFVLYPSGNSAYTDDVVGQDCMWWSVEEEQGRHAPWEAYPNPVDEVLYFMGQPDDMSIVDIYGRKWMSFNPLACGMQIPVDHLAPGLYWLLDEWGHAQGVVVE